MLFSAFLAILYLLTSFLHSLWACKYKKGIFLVLLDLFSVFIFMFMRNLSSHMFLCENQMNLCGNLTQIHDSHKFYLKAL